MANTTDDDRNTKKEDGSLTFSSSLTWGPRKKRPKEQKPRRARRVLFLSSFPLQARTRCFFPPQQSTCLQPSPPALSTSAYQSIDLSPSFSRRLTELHERSSVGGEDDSHPVEGVCRLVGSNAVQRNLTADEEDGQRDESPQNLLFERNPPLRGLDLWEDTHHGLHQIQKTN